MANPEHVRIVKQGIDRLTEWRERNPDEPLDLINADLRRINLVEDDLLDDEDDFLGSGSRPGADLCNAQLQGANLTNAYLFRARLVGADLSRADLTRAYLPWADLRHANLLESNLTGVDLREADLAEAKLTRARLIGADISAANLTRTDLRGTDLTAVKNLRPQQIDSAFIDSETKLPKADHSDL
ncbi:MAG: pentapeptide repeat-containing protein [Planctomycetes bacterium]|nr:pentapeptide repeat-containing protein [Planctomycetota bacterium]MBL7039914.1 pentapeptide repeat-containing protein [Pirellulaceae bacterium]